MDYGKNNPHGWRLRKEATQVRLKVSVVMTVLVVALLVVAAVPAFAQVSAYSSPHSSCAVAGGTVACAVSNFFGGLFGFFYNLFGF